MARKKTTTPNKVKKTRSLKDLVGPPSILFGESKETYNGLLERVNDALKPADIFEEFAAMDLTNAMLDSMRFARLKSELINANMHRGLEQVLKPLCEISVVAKSKRMPYSADDMAAGWACGLQDWIEEVDGRLDDAELSMDAVVAGTLSLEMQSFEAMDRLATSAEARRYTILREIERRREAVRETPAPAVLRGRPAALDKVEANDNQQASKSDDIIDVQCEEVEADVSAEVTTRPPKVVGE